MVAFEIIVVNDFLDVPTLQETYTYRAVTDDQRALIIADMEVRVRRGEYIRIKIESVDDQTLIGKVLTDSFNLSQPFEFLDFVQFQKKNVVDIYDIDRWGVLY